MKYFSLDESDHQADYFVMDGTKGCVMLPQDRYCSDCGKPFKAQTAMQDICPACLIKPHRKVSLTLEEEEELSKGLQADNTGNYAGDIVPAPTEVSTIPKTEETKMPTFAERACIDCKKPYTPTSGSQRRCVACIEIFKHAKPDPKTSALKKVADMGKLKAPGLTPDEIDARAVLRVLIACRVLTEGQVTSAWEAIERIKKSN